MRVVFALGCTLILVVSLSTIAWAEQPAPSLWLSQEIPDIFLEEPQPLTPEQVAEFHSHFPDVSGSEKTAPWAYPQAKFGYLIGRDYGNGVIKMDLDKDRPRNEMIYRNHRDLRSMWLSYAVLDKLLRSQAMSSVVLDSAILIAYREAGLSEERTRYLAMHEKLQEAFMGLQPMRVYLEKYTWQPYGFAKAFSEYASQFDPLFQIQNEIYASIVADPLWPEVLKRLQAAEEAIEALHPELTDEFERAREELARSTREVLDTQIQQLRDEYQEALRRRDQETAERYQQEMEQAKEYRDRLGRLERGALATETVDDYRAGDVRLHVHTVGAFYVGDIVEIRPADPHGDVLATTLIQDVTGVDTLGGYLTIDPLDIDVPAGSIVRWIPKDIPGEQGPPGQPGFQGPPGPPGAPGQTSPTIGRPTPYPTPTERKEGPVIKRKRDNLLPVLLLAAIIAAAAGGGGDGGVHTTPPDGTDPNGGGDGPGGGQIPGFLPWQTQNDGSILLFRSLASDPSIVYAFRVEF